MILVGLKLTVYRNTKGIVVDNDIHPDGSPSKPLFGSFKNRGDNTPSLISPPWSGKLNGFTSMASLSINGFNLLFEAFLIQMCRSMPVHLVSKLTDASDHRLWLLLELYVNAARQNEEWYFWPTHSRLEPMVKAARRLSENSARSGDSRKLRIKIPFCEVNSGSIYRTKRNF